MTHSPTRFERRLDASRALAKAEAAGEVADGMNVRLAILARIESGEITLEQGQAELKRIKSAAKKTGQPTRASFFRR